MNYLQNLNRKTNMKQLKNKTPYQLRISSANVWNTDMVKANISNSLLANMLKLIDLACK